MTGRAVIFIVIGTLITAAVIFTNIEAGTTSLSANFNASYRDQTARNIAQSGVRMGARQLANYPSWRTGFALMDLLGGKVKVSVADTTFLGSSVVKIFSIGIASYNQAYERRDTSIAYFKQTTLRPISVKGLIQANANASTAGGIVLDGRNHSAPPPDPPTLIDTTGTYAVWTTNTFSPGGSSSFGGTAGGKDYAPSSSMKKNGAVVSQNQTWPGGYPTTPDSAAGGPANGYPEGTLKSFAQSGVSGSQYVTDPALLKYPFSGVTYVELPPGVIWSAKTSATVYGSGILVVHNSACNAAIKNISGITGNMTFAGLIIADDIVHLHNEVIGAVIELTTTPSEGSCIGNSNGSMYFSRQAILNATNNLNLGTASATNIVGWWE